MRAALPAPPGKDAVAQQRIPDHAVDPLHEARAFEQVTPPRLQHGRIGRQELPAHQRPVGISASRVDPRNQRAQQDLQEREMQPAGGDAVEFRFLRAARLHQVALGPTERQDIPAEHTENDKGQPKVHRQPVRRDRHRSFARSHARGDHPPADRALQPAQDAGQQQAPGPAGRDLARHEKDQESGCPDEPNGAAQLPVAPFPPIDFLEVVQFHPLVHDPPLIDLAVFVEFRLPVGFGHWRNRPGDRAPFCNRQSGIG